MTTDDKPKFTPRPWKVHRKEFHKMGIDFTSVSIHSDNSPIGLIAKMPFQNEFLLIKEYKEKFSQEEIDANAALIAQCPSLYANEERNLGTMRKDIHLLETIAKVCDLNPIVHLTVMAAIGEHQGRVETTEKLLAKCRGEKTDE